MTRAPGTYAILETSQGSIVCRLFEKEAPRTRQQISLASPKA